MQLWANPTVVSHASMTTRIHVVNFGPQPVEVKALTPTIFPKKLYSQESADFYVYDGQDVLVTEVKEKPTEN